MAEILNILLSLLNDNKLQEALADALYEVDSKSCPTNGVHLRLLEQKIRVDGDGSSTKIDIWHCNEQYYCCKEAIYSGEHVVFSWWQTRKATSCAAGLPA